MGKNIITLFVASLAIILAAFISSSQETKEELIEPKLAVEWNKLGYKIAYAEDQFLTFKGQRALSLMHLAVHDALNSVEPRYDRYACSEEGSNASPTAAAAQAAFEVLMLQYPDRQSVLKKELSTWIDQLPDDISKQMGVALGRDCADTILALRKDDGWNLEGSYKFQDTLGKYQTTGSWDGFVMQPGFRLAKPLVLKAPNQFRPPPPPALDSPAYAKAFNEVKEYGETESTVRTNDQTGYAIWWMEFAEGSVNRLARQLSERNNIDLWTANRMFAYLNVSLYDGYIAVWDGKYGYNHWRPVTAIHRADEDDNPETVQDLNWKPLRPTAPFPDYPSAHAAACAASFGVLEHTFGADIQFEMETNTAPNGMPTRSFNSFDEAARECADSRIQLGWHFRYAADEGLVLGRKVVEYILKNQLQPM